MLSTGEGLRRKGAQCDQRSWIFFPDYIQAGFYQRLCMQQQLAPLTCTCTAVFEVNANFSMLIYSESFLYDF